MKRFLILTVSLIISCSVNAQLNKNTWLVGGMGSMYSYNDNFTTPSVNVTGKWRSIDISASVGYFFIDKFSGGLRPYFSSFKGESSGGGSTNYYMLTIGPFTRYYFLQTDRPFNLLADVSYQFGVNQRLGALRSKGKFNTFSIMAGTEIFFNSTAGIELLIGYARKVTSIENSIDEFNSNKRGVQVSIGFQLHLEKN